MLFLPKPKIAKKGEHFGQLYNQLEKCGDICKWILNRIQVMIKIYRIHGQKFTYGEFKYEFHVSRIMSVYGIVPMTNFFITTRLKSRL